MLSKAAEHQSRIYNKLLISKKTAAKRALVFLIRKLAPLIVNLADWQQVSDLALSRQIPVNHDTLIHPSGDQIV